MINKLKAYCSSRKCADIRYENISNYAIVDVKITATNCPTCGGALLWKKENSRSKVKDIVYPRNRPKKVEASL